jgi:hypothetical protein
MVWARQVTLMVSVVASGCAMPGDARVRELRPVLAHWVERSDTFDPLSGDFHFNALSFPTPTEGWIVGNRYVLHITGNELSVFFVKRTGAWLGSVDFRSSDDGWVGGFALTGGKRLWEWDAPSRGVIWRFRSGRWEPAHLGGIEWDWLVGAVRPSPSGTIWATGVVETDPDDEHPPAPPRLLRILLRSDDGVSWVQEGAMREGDRRWAFLDACFCPSGTGWFVGNDHGGGLGRRALAVRHRDGVWDSAALPDLPAPARLFSVECLPGDGAVAIGFIGEIFGETTPIVLRFDGTWQRIELPFDMGRGSIGALAALSTSDIWLAVNSRGTGDPVADQPLFLHWREGQWTEVAAPLLPGSRQGGYVFTDMQFVSPDEGWAIADDVEGPGLERGLIFHYRDGAWRNRNWNWHFWNAPGFGLWEH